ncbi:uncharacterized protein N7529_009178 [Penicillium soppii]|uniref:uncharacterized protein n=1 Tax=Penicillium soppii TaxID=69789 RepID=UPI002546F632|nr:uncharacterized protein N7529_009178 [Penicillium soppii]KAJ5861868.1 hypothetical protein N7529_009178 [Penicillium soppii]
MNLILKNIPGANKVIVFDHNIRRQDLDAYRRPLYRAHVDQSAKAAAECVLLHVSDEEQDKSIIDGGHRYRIINVWRPINGTVDSNPLALVDVSIGYENDFVSVEFRSPDRTGDIMLIQPNQKQKWMYFSVVQEFERPFPQCFGSKSQEKDNRAEVATRLPHTAFWDPRTLKGAKKRESIEVRALVFR